MLERWLVHRQLWHPAPNVNGDANGDTRGDAHANAGKERNAGSHSNADIAADADLNAYIRRDALAGALLNRQDRLQRAGGECGDFHEHRDDRRRHRQYVCGTKWWLASDPIFNDPDSVAEPDSDAGGRADSDTDTDSESDTDADLIADAPTLDDPGDDYRVLRRVHGQFV
jgi:hypothetical protein